MVAGFRVVGPVIGWSVVLESVVPLELCRSCNSCCNCTGENVAADDGELVWLTVGTVSFSRSQT